MLPHYAEMRLLDKKRRRPESTVSSSVQEAGDRISSGPFGETPKPLNKITHEDALARLREILGESLELTVASEVTTDFTIQFRSAGEAFTFDRDLGSKLSVVLFGFVRKEWRSGNLGPGLGAIFGQDEWFESHIPTNQVLRTVAVQNSWLASLQAGALDQLVERSTAAGQSILCGLNAAIVSASDLATNMVLKDSAGRMATLLLDLERRFGRRQGSRSYVEHNLRQSDLGQVSGCSRETANRILLGFADKGVLSIRSMSFELHDRDWLVKRAR